MHFACAIAVLLAGADPTRLPRRRTSSRPSRAHRSAAKVPVDAWRQFARDAHAAAVRGLPADCSHPAEAVRMVRLCLQTKLLTPSAMMNPMRRPHLAALLTFAASMIHGPTNSSMDVSGDWEDMCTEAAVVWDPDNDRNFTEGSPGRQDAALRFAQQAALRWALEGPCRFGRDPRCSWAQGRRAAAAMSRAHALCSEDEERAVIRRAVSLEWALFEAEAGASGIGPPGGSRLLRERMLRRLSREDDETAYPLP